MTMRMRPPAKAFARRLAIETLVSSRTLDAAAIDRFFEDHTFPIVEGNHVTFVYRGEADAVYLHIWIYGMPSAQPYRRIGASNVWYLIQELPEKSRVEYKLEVVQGTNRRLIEDPLNPEVTHDPFGSNSVCHGAGYEIPEWTVPDPVARRGTVEPLAVPSRALGGTREVSIYVPARFRKERRYPLLIAHDGLDYVHYAGLQTVLDNLIHRLEIPPMVVALTQSQRRLIEYAGHEGHAKFLVEELVPALQERYPLLDRPDSRGLLGASFGAVASLHAGWQYPGFFGRLFLQSGSFAFSDIGPHHRGPVFDPVVEFMNDFRSNPTAVSEKVYLTCGIYESLIYENRSLAPLLQSTEMELKYVESRDGHNWENWRDTFRNGLSWLFPGPLWMVYE
jgi:enterochelin esterase family protein